MTRNIHKQQHVTYKDRDNHSCAQASRGKIETEGGGIVVRGVHKILDFNGEYFNSCLTDITLFCRKSKIENILPVL